MLSTKQKTAIIIAGVVVVCIFIFYMTTKTNNYNYSSINNVIEEDTKEEDTEEEEKVKEPKEIAIHITGEVENEGIVRLKEGARMADAVEAAGGTTNEANLELINLAYLLKDGQKIYIPKISESDQVVFYDEVPIGVIVDGSTEENSTLDEKVNINTANIGELTTISGIGEKTAMKIIEYRETNGKFKTIEDIRNVSGIGEAKYENIKDYICVN